MRFYDSDSGTESYRIEIVSVTTGEVTFSYHSNAFRSFACASDGNRLAIAEGDRIVVFNHDSGVQLATLDDLQGEVTDLAFNLSGDLLSVVSADERTVTLWRTSSAERLATFHSVHNDLVRIAISPTNRWLAVASSDGNVQLWDLEEVKNQLRGVGLDWFE